MATTHATTPYQTLTVQITPVAEKNSDQLHLVPTQQDVIHMDARAELRINLCTEYSDCAKKYIQLYRPVEITLLQGPLPMP